MKGKILIISILLVLFTVGGYAVYLYLKKQKEAREKAEAEKAQAQEVAGLMTQQVLAPPVVLAPATGLNTSAATAQTPMQNPPILREPVLSTSLQAQQAINLKASILAQGQNKDLIKSRFGIGSNLYNGVPEVLKSKIEQLFAFKFGINPNVLLSYPLWSEYENELLRDELSGAILKANKGGLSLKMDAKVTDITAWGINTRTLTGNLYNPAGDMVANYGSNRSGFLGISPVTMEVLEGNKKFHENALSEIERFNTALKTEAINLLRLEGWQFLDV